MALGYPAKVLREANVKSKALVYRHGQIKVEPHCIPQMHLRFLTFAQDAIIKTNHQAIQFISRFNIFNANALVGTGRIESITDEPYSKTYFRLKPKDILLNCSGASKQDYDYSSKSVNLWPENPLYIRQSNLMHRVQFHQLKKTEYVPIIHCILSETERRSNRSKHHSTKRTGCSRGRLSKL